MEGFASGVTASTEAPRRGRVGLKMLARGVAAVVLILATMLGSLGNVAAAPPEAAPSESVEFSMPNGWFYTQTNGRGGGSGLGYSVMDDSNAQFWSAFRRLGGVNAIGYPVSRRFEWKGLISQAFQKVVLQWQPSTGQVAFVNVFDEMTSAGKDRWLKDERSTPERLVLAENGVSWDQIVNNRLSFLEANPAIKSHYFATSDYLSRYGLPTSRVEDLGNAYVIRLQRAVMQQWKVNVPWARAGDVTVANGGDIGKESGLFPESALKIEGSASTAVSSPGANATPRNPRALTVVIDAGHGGSESGAIHRFADGSIVYEKDVNLRVATMLGNELFRLGYNVVMTRRADTRVNGSGDITNDRLVNLNDDLQARVDIANNSGADIFVAVHHNGSGTADMRGTEVYYCDARPFSNDSRDLAMNLQAGLIRSFREAGYPAIDRGYKVDSKALGAGRHYYLLGPKSSRLARPSSMPSIIGEALFVSNDQEANLLRQEGFLAAEARGYVHGINAYFASRGK